MSKIPIICKLEGCQNLMLVPKSLLVRRKFCCKEHAHLSYRKGKELTCMWCEKPFYTSPSHTTNGRGKFCCHEHSSLYYGNLRRKRTNILCTYEPCGKTKEVLKWHVENGGGKFCSSECYHLHKASLRQLLPEPQKIIWNPAIAWLVGLIATDGCMAKYRANIIINSKDKDLLIQVEEIARTQITGRKYKVSPRKKGNYKWWSYCFEAPYFYNFLLSIGIMPNKSLILNKIEVPYEFFSHFLRGVIDGDGCIQPRIVDKKEYLRVRVGSASAQFIKWLYNMCNNHIQLRGGGLYKYKDRDFWELSYSHYDSLKIINYIYRDAQYYLAYKKCICEKYIGK